MRSLFDTNVLVYADAHDEPERQARALELIEAHRLAGTAVVSTQVLQEYVNVAIRRLKLPLSLVRDRLRFYSRFELVSTTTELIAGAIDLHTLHGLAFYDALIVRAAIASGCKCVLSEDMHDGAVFDGVSIINPFRRH